MRPYLECGWTQTERNPGRKCQKVNHKATVPPSPTLIPLFGRSDFERLFGQLMVVGGQLERMQFWLDGRSHISWDAHKPNPGEETEVSRNDGIHYCSMSALRHPDR